MRTNTDHIRASVGRRIRAMREAEGLSQSALGELTGKSQTSVSAQERGTIGIPIEDLLSLCDALGVSCEDLLAGLP